MAQPFHIIAFSKDRPAQTDLLLRSRRKYLAAPSFCTVIYSASTASYEKGFSLLKDYHQSEVTFVPESVVPDTSNPFRAAMLWSLNLNKDVPLTMIVADDSLFCRNIEHEPPEFGKFLASDSVETLSMRLGKSLTHCYMSNTPMSTPVVFNDNRFNWAGQPGDWGYPMSLEGNLYKTKRITEMFERIDFCNPPTLEATLNANTAALLPEVAIMEGGPGMLNVPHNQVQQVFANRYEGGSQYTLNQQFLSGRRICLQSAVDGPHEACHVPRSLTLI